MVVASSRTRTFRLERTIITSGSQDSRSKMVAATSWYCHGAGEDSSRFYYPWPVNIFGPSGASNSNDTDTAHGPLDIKLSVNSFNFTQGTKTISQPSWNIPYRVNVVFWIKVYNNGLYPIALSKYTNLYLFCEPPGKDCEDTQTYFVSDNRTKNPSSVVVTRLIV